MILFLSEYSSRCHTLKIRITRDNYCVHNDYSYRLDIITIFVPRLYSITITLPISTLSLKNTLHSSRDAILTGTLHIHILV